MYVMFQDVDQQQFDKYRQQCKYSKFVRYWLWAIFEQGHSSCCIFNSPVNHRDRGKCSHFTGIFDVSSYGKIDSTGIHTLVIRYRSYTLCIPFEIFDIRFSYTFSSVGACKCFRFLNHAVTLSSWGLLTAIAIERYKINNRLQTRQSRNLFVALNIASLVVVAISIAISIPVFVFYGLSIKETGISDLTGTDCTVLSEYQHMHTADVYTGIVIILSIACSVICAVVYGKLLFVICVQMKKERKDMAKSSNYEMDISSELTSKDTQQVSSIQLNDVPSISSSLGKNVPSPVKTHKRSKYEKCRQLTTSLIVATAVSYLGYTIYASTILVKIANPTLYKNSIRPVSAILLRAYFINNAANPVVFCFLDNTFRTECVKLYKKTMCAKYLSTTCWPMWFVFLKTLMTCRVII